MELFSYHFHKKIYLKNFLENSSFLERNANFFLIPREEFKTEENPKYSKHLYKIISLYLPLYYTIFLLLKFCVLAVGGGGGTLKFLFQHVTYMPT